MKRTPRSILAARSPGPRSASRSRVMRVRARLKARRREELIAQVDRRVKKRDLIAMLDRAPGRAGTQEVRALIAEPAFTRSHAERVLADLVRRASLPRPAFNAIVEGFEMDAVWRPERVLEVDGHAFHAARAAFERDRRKDAALTRVGYLVLRTTWRELSEQPYALVARIAEALAARRV
ncbi:MAG: DUF559 domain-containing protein [Solirubrobacteraceae bacterium]